MAVIYAPPCLFSCHHFFFPPVPPLLPGTTVSLEKFNFSFFRFLVSLLCPESENPETTREKEGEAACQPGIASSVRGGAEKGDHV